MAGANESEAYVWVWLPGAADPVVAGRIWRDGEVCFFTYGRSYRDRANAIPLYLPELPLVAGAQRPRGAMAVAGCLRDAGPDAWGQRLILARRSGGLIRDRDPGELGLLVYLLESGSDRIGALDFQRGPDAYVARTGGASLEEMQHAADRFLAGEPLSPDLDAALLRGTSIGGARPKVLLRDGLGAGLGAGPGAGRDAGPPRELIAKLSVHSDPYPVVKAEAIGMDLAHRVGLDVAPTSLIESLGRDVLLVERFDRPVLDPHRAIRSRRSIVSALTMLELDEIEARYATYPDLADLIRARFTNPDATLRELFARIVFNICIGNTDDHARNHAAFWDGAQLTLTPAYDLCPQLRSGETAEQAMAIARDGNRASRFAVCRAASAVYHLTRAEADAIIDHQVTVITEQWEAAADAARLTRAERDQLWGRQILNPAVRYEV